MTLKQLAERLGVDVKQLDFEIDGPCKNCSKCGGNKKPDCDDCTVVTAITIKESSQK
jgi:hypothetical protein